MTVEDSQDKDTQPNKPGEEAPQQVILNPRAVGYSLLAVGLFLILTYRFVPQNIQIADLLALPLGPFFVFLGVLFSLYNQPIIVRYRPLIALLRPLPRTKKNLKRTTELRAFFEDAFAKRQLPNEESIPQ